VNYRPPTPLIWFAVLGGPLAWITQFVSGMAFANAQCEEFNASRWQLPVHAWQIAFAAAAVLVALAAEAASVYLFRRSRGTRNRFYEPTSRGDTSLEPVGRAQFFAMLGLTVNPLALAIIVMSGVGAPLLHLCHQS
jgi:hypothetical protein